MSFQRDKQADMVGTFLCTHVQLNCLKLIRAVGQPDHQNGGAYKFRKLWHFSRPGYNHNVELELLEHSDGHFLLDAHYMFKVHAKYRAIAEEFATWIKLEVKRAEDASACIVCGKVIEKHTGPRCAPCDGLEDYFLLVRRRDPKKAAAWLDKKMKEV